MHRSVYILMVALLVIAAGGYLLPEKTEVLPGRILMQNAGGRVIFDHGKHMQKYGADCASCHHDAVKPSDHGSDCYSCHNTIMSKQIKVSCKTCHGVEFNDEFKKTHTTMTNDRQVCLTCHHTETAAIEWLFEQRKTLGEEDINIKMPSCGNCHKEEPKKLIPGSMAAYHGQCIECHKQQGGPADNCAQCHRK